jgi:prevent-host-death family protein
MPTIEKVSALRNYNQVLDEVRPGAPVYLTKNGTGKYALVDISDISKYDTSRDAMWQSFFSYLDSVCDESDKDGWIPSDDIEREFGLD